MFHSLLTLFCYRHPEILKDRDLSGELKDVWNAVQALRDKQRAENHYATQENLVLYTEFGPESAPPMYQQQQQQQQQRETVIQYSGQSAITNNTNTNGMQTMDDATTLKDHMEKISSETENMRISPTEPSNNKGESNETMHDIQSTQTLPINNPTTTTTTTTVSSPTSVIMSTGNVTVNGGGGQPSPTNNKKDSTSSSSFLTKFRSSKTSQQSHHQQNNHQDQSDATPNTVQQDVSNKKDSDNGGEHHPHPQSKHKKFLSYIRRKAGTKNDNYTNRESRKGGLNGDNNTTANNVTSSDTKTGNHNGNTEDTDLGKQEIIEAPIIDAK